MDPNNLLPIDKLPNCDFLSFDCGVPELNTFLTKYALQSHNSDSARTCVAFKVDKAIGYYSLTYGSVSMEETPVRVAKGLPKHPVPVMLLARLAVNKVIQKNGVGKALLKNAFKRTIQAAEIGGLRAMIVHAKDKNAKTFYEQYGFESAPINEFHLFLLMKDIRKFLP